MLSIVVPVYKEKNNIRPLVSSLKKTLGDRAYEIIFVDDNSPDGTINVIWELARHDPTIRGILRIKRRGLSSAVCEGILSSSADIVVVMDGDLQHDEQAIPRMLGSIEDDGNDICVASRFLSKTHSQGLANHWRVKLSTMGTDMAQKLSDVTISDPLSGFFAMKRELFVDVAPHLFLRGYKILLDILTIVPPTTKVAEIPMTFRKRQFGESKLNLTACIDFLFFFLYRAFDKLLCFGKK